MAKSATKVDLLVGLKNEKDTIRKIHQPKHGKFEQVVSVPNAPAEKQVNPVILVNRLRHPATFSYNGEATMLPARGRRKYGNREKLGALPSGVSIIPFKK